MDAKKIANVVRQRVADGHSPLADGQWLEEVLVRGRPDGSLGCHVVIGQRDGFGQVSVTPPLPVDVIGNGYGIPAAELVGETTLAVAADRDARERERDEARQERDEARDHHAHECERAQQLEQQLTDMGHELKTASERIRALELEIESLASHDAGHGDSTNDA